MKRILWCLLCGLGIGTLSAQTLRLTLPEETVAPGETVTLPLTVTDFDSIVSVQFSINWDVTVATYDEFALEGLPLLAVGDFQAADGELRVSWFDNTGNGRTLADGTAIASFTFTAVGEPGDETLLPVTDDPLDIQIFKATPEMGVFTPVSLEQDIGRITIEGALGFSVEQSGVSCFGDEDGMAQVSFAVDTAAYTLNWMGPNDFTATGYQQSGLAAGSYELSLLDPDGQEAFTYTLVIAGPAAPLNLEDVAVTDTDCNTPTGAVVAQVAGGTAPYVYLLNNEVSATGNFSELSAGEYTLQVQDANDCTVSQSLTVVAPDAPQLNLPDTLLFCGDEPLVIQPDAEGIYVWSTGSTADSLVVTEAGVYGLTVTNTADCSSSATVEVLLSNEVNAQVENDFLELCPGDTLQLMVSGGEVYEWLPPTAGLSDTGIANPLAVPDSSTTYQVRVSNSCGADTLAVPVFVFPITATAGQDTCVAPGDVAQLNARGGVFYQWADNPYPVSDPSIPTPTVMPDDSTTYQVTITDINGCVTEDEVTVLVANNPVETILAVNLITPNEDGLNDVLDFGPIQKYGTNSLKVYNRWGNLVYQKLNYQSDEERFDGTYKGEPLPAANYFYVLSFRQGSIKQTLTLIRE